jgi:hypothetical protein
LLPHREPSKVSANIPIYMPNNSANLYLKEP